MFKFNDQEIEDKDVARAYWERIQKRMEVCRDLAKSYFQSSNKRKCYRMDYQVDPGTMTVYADFSDDDLKIIKDSINESISEYGPFASHEDETDFWHDNHSDMDIDWYEFIPEEDMHWAGGEPTIVYVDLDDWKFCCNFSVIYSKDLPGATPESSRIRPCYLTEDEYVDLLAFKLFDNKLTFSDLRHLMPELHEKIFQMANTPHFNHIVLMSEITETAQKIIDNNKELYPDWNPDNPFFAVIINSIVNYAKEVSADDKLLNAFKIRSGQFFY